MSSTTATAPATTAAARWLTPIELIALGAIWGASFLFMRIAAHDFGSFALVEVRLALGAIILLPFLWRAREQFQTAHWWKVAGIAAINSAIPFTLFAWAAQRAPAGIGAICNATAVMFTALIAFMFFGEQITRRRAIGLVIGFIGAAVLASGKTAGDRVWPAACAGILAAFMYGIGANLTRRHLSFAPPSAIAAATLLCGTIMLAPLAIATWPEVAIPTKSWLSAAMLGALCTGAAYLLFYRLIYRIGAPGASTVTYLIPLFGVLWAWVFLQEPLTPTMAIAGALILGGVGLSQKR